MELVANILLAAGAIGAGLYCLVLARRLKRFNDLEKGVGGAVAVLSSQVDDLQRSLVEAKQAAENSWESIEDLTKRAEAVAQRLEIMMASMHDITEDSDASPALAPQEPVEDNGPIFVRHSRSGDDVHH